MTDNFEYIDTTYRADDGEKTYGILAITILTVIYIITEIFIDIDPATSQIVSTAIGGILGITVGRATR